VDSSNGSNLISEEYFHRDSIKVFYFDNEQKQFANIKFVGNFRVNDIIETNITLLLPTDQINTAYLYPNQYDIDTITFRTTKSSDDCWTSYPLDSISINGKPVDVDPVDFSFLIKKEVLK
jgi:hypothetical protein